MMLHPNLKASMMINKLMEGMWVNNPGCSDVTESVTIVISAESYASIYALIL